MAKQPGRPDKREGSDPRDSARSRSPRRRSRRRRGGGQRGRGTGASDSPKAEQILQIQSPRDRFLGSTILLIALALLVGAGVMIFWPFWSPLFLAATFTTICYPVYARVLSALGGERRTLASILTCALFILVLLVPVAWGAWALFTQAPVQIKNAGDKVEDMVLDLREQHPEYAPYLDEWEADQRAREIKATFHEIAKILGAKDVSLGDETDDPNLAPGADGAVDPPDADAPDVIVVDAAVAEELTETAFPQSAFGVLGRVSRFVARLLADVFGVVVRFFLMIFLMFYFFRDGHQLLAGLRSSIPVASSYQTKVIDTYKGVVSSLLRGTLVTACLQGAVAGVAFQIVGISGFFWGAVAAVCALVPLAGTGLVTIPVILYFLIQQQFGSAVFLVFVAIVIASMDNFVRPYLLKGDLKMHPVWILLSFLGGVSAFGPVGIIVGPMVVVLLGTVLALVRQDRTPLRRPGSDPVSSAATNVSN